eukprot:6981578-Pyramimonas_sp.AAC.1
MKPPPRPYSPASHRRVLLARGFGGDRAARQVRSAHEASAPLLFSLSSCIAPSKSSAYGTGSF